jgi:hypothetical protein
LLTFAPAPKFRHALTETKYFYLHQEAGNHGSAWLYLLYLLYFYLNYSIMKTSTLFTIVLLCFSWISLSAQTEKGSMLIGGTAGFSSSKQGELKSTDITFAPMLAVFIIDQLAVGGEIGIGFSKAEFLNEEDKATSFGFAPMVRYYINGSGNIRAFGHGTFRWASVKFDEQDAQSGIGFGAALGVDFFINNHVAIEAALGYDNFKISDAEEGTGTFGLNLGVVAFIGGGN